MPRRTTRLFSLLVLAVVTAVPTACGSAPEQDMTALEGTRWVAVALRSPAGTLEPASAGVTTTVRFTAGTVDGNGGVNQYSGTYEASAAGRMSIELGAATAMAGPQAAMKQEALYFDLLPDVAEFAVVGEPGALLELLDGAGEVVVRFEPLSDQALEEGTTWQRTAHDSGAGGVVSVASRFRLRGHWRLVGKAVR